MEIPKNDIRGAKKQQQNYDKERQKEKDNEAVVGKLDLLFWIKCK